MVYYLVLYLIISVAVWSFWYQWPCELFEGRGRLVLAFGMEGKWNASWVEDENVLCLESSLWVELRQMKQIMEGLKYQIAVMGKMRIISVPFFSFLPRSNLRWNLLHLVFILNSFFHSLCFHSCLDYFIFELLKLLIVLWINCSVAFFVTFFLFFPLPGAPIPPPPIHLTNSFSKTHLRHHVSGFSLVCQCFLGILYKFCDCMFHTVW